MYVKSAQIDTAFLVTSKHQLWSNIFRVQTRRVPQTLVFRYREIGGALCKKHRKK
jgi:hypothetical protein